MAAAGVADAAESAFRNQNLPVRELKRRGKLRVPIFRERSRTQADRERSNETGTSDRSERSRTGQKGRRASERSIRSNRASEYGPPPGYQPIILPGESISKYQRMAQSQSGSPSSPEPVLARLYAAANPAVPTQFRRFLPPTSPCLRIGSVGNGAAFAENL